MAQCLCDYANSLRYEPFSLLRVNLLFLLFTGSKVLNALSNLSNSVLNGFNGASNDALTLCLAIGSWSSWRRVLSLKAFDLLLGLRNILGMSEMCNYNLE